MNRRKIAAWFALIGSSCVISNMLPGFMMLVAISDDTAWLIGFAAGWLIQIALALVMGLLFGSIFALGWAWKIVRPRKKGGSG